jgi:hypothetical protein
MLELKCPYCGAAMVSDVIDHVDEVDGVWECRNDHQWNIQYLAYLPPMAALTPTTELGAICHDPREKLV